MPRGMPYVLSDLASSFLCLQLVCREKCPPQGKLSPQIFGQIHTRVTFYALSSITTMAHSNQTISMGQHQAQNQLCFTLLMLIRFNLFMYACAVVSAEHSTEQVDPDVKVSEP